MDIEDIKNFLKKYESPVKVYKLYSAPPLKLRITIDTRNVYKEVDTHVYLFKKCRKNIEVLCVNKKTGKLDSFNDEPAYLRTEYEFCEKIWAKNGIVHRPGNFPAWISGEPGGINQWCARNGYIWCSIEDDYTKIYYIMLKWSSVRLFHNLLGPAYKDEYYIYGKKYTKEEYTRVVKSARKIYLRNRFHTWVRSFLKQYVWNPTTEYGKIWIDQKYDDLNEFQNSCL